MRTKGAPAAPEAWPATERWLREEAGRLRRRASAAAAGTAVAGASGLLLLLTLLPPAALGRRGSPLAVAALLLLAALVAAALVSARREGRRLRPGSLAGELEGAAGLAPGDVRGALELGVPRAGESASLARLHRERVGRAVTARRPAPAFPDTGDRLARRSRRAGLSALAALLLLGIGVAARPGAAAGTARALAGAWGTAFPPPLPPLGIEPGDAEVRRGRHLQVRVEAPGRERVVLAWRVPGERTVRRELRVDAAGGAGGTVGPVEAPARYWAAAPDGALSDTFAVRPVDPLVVEALRVRVLYPSHLEREAETHERPIPDLLVPAGSRLLVEGRASRPLRRAGLRRSPPPERRGGPDVAAVAGEDAAATGRGPAGGAGTAVTLVVADDRFSGSLRPGSSGAWRWEIEPRDTAAAGRAAILPDPLSVEVMPDRPPSLAILFPGRDTLLGTERVLPLVVEAADDFGLSRVELVSWPAGGDERAESEEEPNRVEELEEARGVRRAVLRPLLDLRDRGLLPGDTLLYIVRARDGHPRHGPAVSDTFRVGLATLAGLRDRAAADAEAVAAGAREARAAADGVSRAAREAAGRAGSEEPGGPGGEAASERTLGFEATEEGRRVLAGGEALEARLEALEEEVGRAAESLAAAPLADPSLVAELRRAEDLLRELRESALGERLRDLGEALRALDAGAVREALSDVAAGSDDLAERLERTLGMLERVALEGEVAASRAEAERLAVSQRELAGEETLDRAWSAREAGLAREAATLAARVDEVERRLREAGTRRAAESAGEAAERAREARAAMETAARRSPEAGSGPPVEAAHGQPPAGTGTRPPAGTETGPAATGSASPAASAADFLEGAAEALSAAAEAMGPEWREEALEAIRRARQEALGLAREQGGLADLLFGPAALEGARWRAGQAAVRQGLERLTRSLSEAGRRTGLLEARIGPLAAETGRRMDGILSRMAASGGRRRPSRDEADGVVQRLNELALALLSSEEAVRGEESADGAAEARRLMEALAGRQRGIARRTGGLGDPDVPGQGEGDRLDRLSREQAEAGRRLRELAGAPLLGDPEALARDAERLARRLASGRSDAETVADQRRLFRRMLDAGRTLEGDETDPARRESRTGRAVGRPPPPPDPAALAGPRFPHPAEALLRELPAAYRRLVSAYFDRLNGAGGPVAPAPDGGGPVAPAEEGGAP